MATNQIKFNSKAFRAILVGGGTQAAVASATQQISASAGGLHVSMRIGKYGGGRAIAYVQTTAKTAAKANAQREALEAATSTGG